MDPTNSPSEEGLPLVDSRPVIKTLKRSHSRDVHILSLAFLLVFSAYGAVQNLESTVNTEGDLGTISLGILYVSFTVFSLFASPVVRKMGSKTALVLGTSGYWLFTAANLKPNWYTMVPASVYMGFCASIIWVGQGTYLTSTACNHAKDSNLHEGTVIGNFNGEFWGVYATHQVIGNLISLLLLRDGAGQKERVSLFFTGERLHTSEYPIPSSRLGGSRIRAMGDVLYEERPRESSAGCCSFVASVVKSIIAPWFDIHILLIIPLFAYSGLQQAFVWSEFTKKIVKPALGESGIGGSMAVYGAADAICSLVAGQLTSGLSSVTWIVLGGSSAHAIILLWILIKYSTTGGLLGTIYPLLMAAALGMGDGVLMTQINALIGMLFKHDMEGAFAQLKVWQSLCIAVLFFLTPYISLHAMAAIMLTALCISLAAFLVLTLKVAKASSF